MKFMRKKILMLSALCLIALTASFASLAEEPVERIVLESGYSDRKSVFDK